MFNGHTYIMGRTGTGKTYFLVHSLLDKEKEKAVFYFLGGHDVFTPAYSHALADMHTPTNAIIKALRKKQKVFYTPSIYQKTAIQELKHWQEVLMSDVCPHSLLFCVDEVARYAPQGSIDTACHLLATGGRRWRIESFFLSQRIADVSKTLVTQCSHIYIFEHAAFETNYLKGHGIILEDDHLEHISKKYNKLHVHAGVVNKI